MGIEFSRPILWLSLPFALAVLWLIDRRHGARRGPKHALTRAAHGLLALLLVAALAAPAVSLPGNSAATWALIDLSASSQGQRGAMEAALREGLAQADESLSIGSIAFGQRAMVDTPLAAGRKALPLGVTPEAGGTDIGRALQMAAALLPADAAGRIALLSDGRDNADGLDAALRALEARGIAVDVLPFPSGFARDAQVTSVTPPAFSYQNETFDVTVRLHATFATEGTLVLYANREPIATRDVTLREGENTFIFRDKAAMAGVVTYEAELIARGDENLQNNRLGAYMDVCGTARALVVGTGSELPRMLRAAGIEVETLLPSQLPETAEALRHYHAIALNNVSADDLSDATLTALSDYARKLGRGVAVFGGDGSYALGGWRGSPLEDMLPVTMDVRNQLDLPSLSLVLVIDKSGSMSEGRFGITRLDMAKEAAMRSTEVLTAQDTIGVIGFDSAAKWVVPMQPVRDTQRIEEMIGTLVPDGGTAFHSPLMQALEAQLQATAQLRHVLFLTDGEAADSGHETIIEMMAENGITLTTVAVGDGANTRLLQSYAELGNGRFYAANAFDDLPKIFTKETYLAAESFVQNRDFTPVVRSGSALTGFDGFPLLRGYLSTTIKPLATLSMASDRDDPLLSWWQYGAGRVLAWTSDAEGAWTDSYLRWADGPAFFAGMISHILPQESSEGDLSVAREGETVSIRYAVADSTPGLSTEATVWTPDGDERKIPLAATAPGVFEGTLNAPQEGVYAVRVEQRDGSQLVRSLESGIAVGYSREHDLRGEDGAATLARIAKETGGRLLTDPAELFTEQGETARARRDIAPPLLALALLLFVLDIAQRRIAREGLLPSARKKEASVRAKKSPKKRNPKPAFEKEQKRPVSETGEKLLEKRKKKLL